jgi:hypothetical protein
MKAIHENLQSIAKIFKMSYAEWRSHNLKIQWQIEERRPFPRLHQHTQYIPIDIIIGQNCQGKKISH